MTIKKQVKSFPKYQIHKASNRGFIWWQGKRHYLGVANSPESFEAYNQFVAEIAQSKGAYKPDLEAAAVSSDATVGTLMALYGLKYCGGTKKFSKTPIIARIFGRFSSFH